MTGTNPLADLASFVGKSEHADTKAASARDRAFWRAYGSSVEHSGHRPVSARVTDLLGTVMTLSARTRRLVAPLVKIELDVFTPDGNRAVLLVMGEVE